MRYQVPSHSTSMNSVTPFVVTSVSDYNKLVTDFGCTPMTQALFDRFEKLTKTTVPIGYRNFVISHRDFGKVLDSIEKHEPVYLYTGRGPSSDRMHLGHLVPFQFCQFLQTALKVPVVIQLTDDEKFIFKEDLTLDIIAQMVVENVKDIIACGFDPSTTFIFTNTGFIGAMYSMVLKIQKLVNLHQVLNTFGFSVDGTSIGKIAFPAMQAAPAFAETFTTTLFKTAGGPANVRKIRCLIPCAIDQDPYFRVCRDIAPRLKHHKPSVIHTKFLPGLEGTQTKMSSSKPESCIFLGDSAKQIRKKINKAFSGGQEFLDDHRRIGGDPNIDVAYCLLTFFAGDNCTQPFENFKSGVMSCGEMKSLAADTVIRNISDFCDKRRAITQETINAYFDANKTLF